MKFSPSEENTFQTVRKLLELNRILVDDLSLKESLMKHPDFPTMACFETILRKYGIACVATKINANRIPEVRYPLISYINGFDGSFFIVLTAITKDSVTYFVNGRRIEESFYEFVKKWNGVVLLMTNSQSSSAKPSKKNTTSHFRVNYHITLAMTLLILGILILLIRNKNVLIDLPILIYLLSSVGFYVSFLQSVQGIKVIERHYGTKAIFEKTFPDRFKFEIIGRSIRVEYYDVLAVLFLSGIVGEILFIDYLSFSRQIALLSVFSVLLLVTVKFWRSKAVLIYDVICLIILSAQYYLLIGLESQYEFNIFHVLPIVFAATIWVLTLAILDRSMLQDDRVMQFHREIFTLPGIEYLGNRVEIGNYIAKDSGIIYGSKSAPITISLILCPFDSIDREIFFKMKEHSSKFNRFKFSIGLISFHAKNEEFNKSLINLLSIEPDQASKHLDLLMSNPRYSSSLASLSTTNFDNGILKFKAMFDLVNKIGIYNTPLVFIEDILLDSIYDFDDIPIMCDIVHNVTHS